MKSKTKDMTNGSPTSLILGFVAPLLLGLLFQQFYSMMDTIIVGKYLGVKQLAGVGSTGAVNFLVLGFCMGTCSGFAIPVAQSFGAGDYRMLRKFVANAAYLVAAFALVITLTVCLLCRNIIAWMNTPADIGGYAYQYIFVIFLGIPASMMYNFLAGVIRSLGDSKTPVMFLVIAACLNIALDLFSILVLRMGVSGAAWATVLAQLISGILCLLYMRRNYEVLRFSGDETTPDRFCLSKLCGMGLPMGLQYSITAIGSVTLQTAVNSLGSTAVAAVTAAMRVNGFCTCPFDALGTTMATYTGQNIGARKLSRVREGVRAGCFIGGSYAALALTVIMAFGRPLVLIFLDSSEEAVLSNAVMIMTANASFFIALSLIFVFRYVIQGMGFSRLAMVAGVFELFARGFVALVLVPALGFLGVCFANPVAWIMADVFLIPAYVHVYRKTQRRLDSEQVQGVLVHRLV